ncbi:MAG: hypothetical protein M3N53_08220 [Actinomycetota bacterium]|nr:hypothetical protein [Actinomycetota bacterium]
MPDLRWVLLDASGAEIRATDRFATREEAEAWMAREWSTLPDEGAQSVSLVEGDETVYEMGLGEE